MKKANSISLWLLVTFPFAAFSQQVPPRDIDIENFVEELFALQDEELNYEELYENLLQLYLSPLNLNRASAEELQSLYILNPLQVNALIDYRSRYGDLLSLYELQAVPEWDLETIYRLLPFVIVEDGEKKVNRPFYQRIGTEKNAYLLLRQSRIWEERKGFTPADTLNDGSLSSRYLGDPHNLYARFRIQHHQDFSLGVTLDKDAGEQFIWEPSSRRYGFNFLSYHVTLYNKGRWKTITLGDYQAQFGQGLVFGAGFSPGKGSETVTTVRRSSMGLRPFTSSMEYGFFRGIAATYSLGRWEMSALYSHTARDGNIQTVRDTLEQEEDVISSLLTSGYHRTATEIANKAKAREQNVGGNLSYKSGDSRFQLGTNVLYTSYSEPFIRTDRIYNGFEFRGKNNFTHSIYFSYNVHNYFLFGETARSQSGGMGTVAGLMSSLTPHLDLSILWRKYDRDFHSFYGNAFAEGSRPINETGVYLGLQYKPNRRVYWNGYFDRFYFPWLRFRAYAPSDGYEWLGRLTYTPSRNIKLFVQLREEVKDRNIAPSETGGGYLLAAGKRRNYAASLDLNLSKEWSIRSRVQFSSYALKSNYTKGYAILQDLNGTWNNFRLSMRFALFDTEDYENRQYIYEKNVLWAFSIPTYYGQGMRYYLLAQYDISNRFTLWARWARTTFTDREEIGSGLQTIQGNTFSESTFQLRYAFNR
ncbi:MAG TPA: helix-hairpin-helix domain-containing protein [Cyclobacteriaceae bacterium]|nr:helix-hairpin-helix domain-containing protein [Cyclobacteriaceae bacterium]